MPICKFCNQPFSWGKAEDKWVPLVPVGEDEDLDRAYQDENGVLRAEHALVCVNRGGPSVRVSRLAKIVPASDVLVKPKTRRRRRKDKDQIFNDDIPFSP